MFNPVLFTVLKAMARKADLVLGNPFNSHAISVACNAELFVDNPAEDVFVLKLNAAGGFDCADGGFHCTCRFATFNNFADALDALHNTVAAINNHASVREILNAARN